MRARLVDDIGEPYWNADVGPFDWQATMQFRWLGVPRTTTEQPQLQQRWTRYVHGAPQLEEEWCDVPTVRE